MIGTLLKNTGGKPQTMTSREIAELTGKEHKNVMQDIRNLQEQVGRELTFELSFIISELANGGSKKLPIYLLTKKETLLLMSGYNAQLRLKIINRWEELENKQVNPAELTRIQILTMALESEKRALEAEFLKREAEERIQLLTHADKMYVASEVAKECGFTSAISLNKFLVDQKIQYLCNGTWVPYSEYANKGYFHMKQDIVNGNRVIYHRKITQAGREFIINLVNKKASN